MKDPWRAIASVVLLVCWLSSSGLQGHAAEDVDEPSAFLDYVDKTITADNDEAWQELQSKLTDDERVHELESAKVPLTTWTRDGVEHTARDESCLSVVLFRLASSGKAGAVDVIKSLCASPLYWRTIRPPDRNEDVELCIVYPYFHVFPRIGQKEHELIVELYFASRKSQPRLLNAWILTSTYLAVSDVDKSVDARWIIGQGTKSGYYANLYRFRKAMIHGRISEVRPFLTFGKGKLPADSELAHRWVEDLSKLYTPVAENAYTFFEDLPGWAFLPVQPSRKEWADSQRELAAFVAEATDNNWVDIPEPMREGLGTLAKGDTLPPPTNTKRPVVADVTPAPVTPTGAAEAKQWLHENDTQKIRAAVTYLLSEGSDGDRADLLALLCDKEFVQWLLDVDMTTRQTMIGSVKTNALYQDVMKLVASSKPQFANHALIAIYRSGCHRFGDLETDHSLQYFRCLRAPDDAIYREIESICKKIGYSSPTPSMDVDYVLWALMEMGTEESIALYRKYGKSRHTDASVAAGRHKPAVVKFILSYIMSKTFVTHHNDPIELLIGDTMRVDRGPEAGGIEVAPLPPLQPVNADDARELAAIYTKFLHDTATQDYPTPAQRVKLAKLIRRLTNKDSAERADKPDQANAGSVATLPKLEGVSPEAAIPLLADADPMRALAAALLIASSDSDAAWDALRRQVAKGPLVERLRKLGLDRLATRSIADQRIFAQDFEELNRLVTAIAGNVRGRDLFLSLLDDKRFLYPDSDQATLYPCFAAVAHPDAVVLKAIARRLVERPKGWPNTVLLPILVAYATDESLATYRTIVRNPSFYLESFAEHRNRLAVIRYLMAFVEGIGVDEFPDRADYARRHLETIAGPADQPFQARADEVAAIIPLLKSARTDAVKWNLDSDLVARLGSIITALEAQPR